MRRETTTTTEFDKDTDVIKKREVLDSLTIAINEGKKELEDIETQKKSKIKELARVVKTFDENDTLVNERIASLKDKEKIQKERLVSINEEIDTKKKEKSDLQEKVDTLSTYFKEEKARIDAEISAYEKEAKKESKALAKSILEQQNVFDQLFESNRTLKVQNENLVANINSNKEVVAKATRTLETAESKEKEITTLIEVKTKEAISLGEDIAEKSEVLSTIEKSITSKEGVLKGVERDIATRKAELDTLNNEKINFEKDKLVFSEQRQLILAKEQFVKDKYELAGLKYE